MVNINYLITNSYFKYLISLFMSMLKPWKLNNICLKKERMDWWDEDEETKGRVRKDDSNVSIGDNNG